MDVQAIDNDLKKGDIVFIGISDADLNGKIKRDGSLGFWSRVMNYHVINANSLSTISKTYMSMETGNTINEKNTPWVMLLYGAGAIFMIGISIYELVNMKRAQGVTYKPKKIRR